jgi:Fe-Mn family superoxide dismutase
MKKFIPKQFNFSNVKYMTPEQLSQHYTLYTKYIDSLNKINVNMNSENMFLNCNSNYSPIRSAEKSTTFCLDAIKLHELYFDNLTGNNSNPYEKVEKIILDNFGSYKSFKDKFKCIGMSMRGWVIFCQDVYTGDYYIYGQDSHDDGVILCAKPLIVLDVYEHAYMIDYGINRDLYIDSFFENLDFKVVNERIS